VVAISASVLASAGSASAAATAVLRGTAEPFAVLAGAGITNTGATTIAGNIGTLPTPTMTVTGQIVLTGTNHADDGVTTTAKADLQTAYTAAAGQAPDVTDLNVATDLAGQTFTPGVYASSSGLLIDGPVPLTLDAQGVSSAVFVFQAASTLVTKPYSQVKLVNGARACNVFWQVGSSTTLGVDSTFRGNILTQVSTTLNHGATLEGSALSLTGAVTMDSNTIKRPTCADSPSGGIFMITSTGTTPYVTPPATVPGPSAGPVGAGGGAGAGAAAGGQVARVPVGPVAAGGGGSAAVGRLWSWATP
jgi:type VI secretion system secreted protein VgrG